MLVPTIANRHTSSDAICNKPALNLLKDIPPAPPPREDGHAEATASVLMLGCGDVRHLLYTAYAQEGLPERKLDLTFCDIGEGVLARNIIFLSFLIDDEVIDLDALWRVYYDLYSSKEDTALVHKQVGHLLDVSSSSSCSPLAAWNNSTYGRIIRFSDEDTARDVRKVWYRIAVAATRVPTKLQETTYNKRVHRWLGNPALLESELLSWVRATGHSTPEDPEAVHLLRNYWANGTTSLYNEDNKPSWPNAMFAGPLDDDNIALRVGLPVESFHTGPAMMKLTSASPLRAPEEEMPSRNLFTPMAGARFWFKEWAKRLGNQLRSGDMVVRFTNADALNFSHTLQNSAATGELTADLYRRQWTHTPLVLAESEYGLQAGLGRAPTRFDVIDSSDLGDHLGLLNILVACTPLLRRDVPWATLNTDIMVKGDKYGRKAFEHVLRADGPLIFALLGITPACFWTDATTKYYPQDSGVLEGDSAPIAHRHLSWKLVAPAADPGMALPRPFVSPSLLATVIFKAYLEMFRETNNDEISERICRQPAVLPMELPQFNMLSLVALLKLLARTVDTSTRVLCSTLLKKIDGDATLEMGSNYRQDLGALLDRHGLHSEAWLGQASRIPELGQFHAWKEMPNTVSVTLVVPNSRFAKLYSKPMGEAMSGPVLMGSLRSESGWFNLFGDLQLTFGEVRTSSERNEDTFSVAVVEDPAGWQSGAPLVASFCVPTAALQVEPAGTLVAVSLPDGPITDAYRPLIDGRWGEVFAARLQDTSHVFVTKTRPGINRAPVLCNGAPEPDARAQGGRDSTEVDVVPSPTGTGVHKLVARMCVGSTRTAALLKAKSPIRLEKGGPFMINLVIGDRDVVFPLGFPLPVCASTARAWVGSASESVDVHAFVTNPGVSDELAGHMFPSVLLHSTSVPTVALSNTPHVNLDTLPIPDTSDAEDFGERLTPFVEAQLSARKNEAEERVNFKTGCGILFREFVGIQSSQTYMFSVESEDSQVEKFFIFVSAVRVDPEASSFVLDAAVAPISLSAKSMADLELFIARSGPVRKLSMSVRTMRLWRRVLPALAERCRTWSHTESCEYRAAGATMPLCSRSDAAPITCSCGAGKFPKGFMTVPDWDQVVAPYAARIAISPVFCSPIVGGATEIDPGRDEAALRPLRPTKPVDTCKTCGRTRSVDGKRLLTCRYCPKVHYCNRDCQKKDWKKHKLECGRGQDHVAEMASMKIED